MMVTREVVKKKYLQPTRSTNLIQKIDMNLYMVVGWYHL